MSDMIYVIGSGPAGISCAYSLIQQGLEVTMLDSGIELESDKKRILEVLSSTNPENWDKNLLDKIKNNPKASTSGIKEKWSFGSNFPYRDVDKYLPIKAKDVVIRQSLARGGLSNVWGAAVLPYIDNDIVDWPISINDLAPHYEAVFSFMNLAAISDDLESIFPLYSKNYYPLNQSKQAILFKEDLESNKSKLKANGFVFGNSRLAVQAHPFKGKPGCVYCGLCLYGCPYGLIYNSSDTLNELLYKENFHYINNVIVQKLKETKDGVSIYCRSRINDEKLYFSGSKVYLACGTVSSTKILLESMEAYGQELSMKDSQFFLIPMIRYKKAAGTTSERLYTLPQLFIELFDQDITKKTINLQIYTYNDLYSNIIKKSPLGIAYPLLKPLINEFLDRLIIIMGFLHSDDSSTILLKLEAPKNDKPSVLVFEPQINKNAEDIFKKVLKKISQNKNMFKAIPISAASTIQIPGYGSHTGGTFPMKRKPSSFETDILGRPCGFNKVHIVDSAVFPSVPATTTTLTIMANAHRIASAFNES